MALQLGGTLSSISWVHSSTPQSRLPGNPSGSGENSNTFVCNIYFQRRNCRVRELDFETTLDSSSSPDFDGMSFGRQLD